ncbi:MAG: hypothetical protein KQA36_02260 [Candidatus Aenigmarchaeota archaeon]|nr:hypothetical protein [Candidatus Aenigmarchaeota archaeon]
MIIKFLNQWQNKEDKKISTMIIIFSLIFVIFFSGCTTIQLPNLIVEEKKVEETSDILKIENIETIPKPPIFSSDSFTLYFTIRNSDSEKTIKDIKINIFDPSVFKIEKEGEKCTNATPCSLLPLDQKIIEFQLKAPEKEEIASVEITPKVSFKVSFSMEARTLYDVVVVNLEELAKYQQAGKTLEVSRNKILSSGPMKIDIELINAEAVIAGKTGKLKFVIKNSGTGYLVDNVIKKGSLTIDMSNFEVEHDMKDLFSCSGGICSNTDDIKIIGKESAPMLFTIKAPSNIELWKTFTIVTKMNYTYELRGNKDIKVIPAE